MAELLDAAARAAVIHERARNVVVDAGPGTGKTSLIIDRVIEMVAPTAADVEPFALERLAVVTFTRRAAGELRYRLRQKLLDRLRAPAPSAARDERLREALGAIDTAHIGTIHGFADRLLRLRPIEAGIGPRHEIVEDATLLVRETFDRLVHAADTGTLGAALADRVAALSVATDEVEDTIRLAHAAGLRLESRALPFTTLAGLDALVGGMITSRDVPFVPDLPAIDLAAYRAAARRIAARLRLHRGDSRGIALLRRVARLLEELAERDSAAEVFRLAHRAFTHPAGEYTLGRDFEKDADAWKDFKNLTEDGDWRGQVIDPLHRWMGARLARLREPVEQLYAQVKAEQGGLDQLDLLVRLRDLLRERHDVRGAFQARFDHLFVDEFQDTDPLQCEIVFYLAEAAPQATTWTAVALAPGKLTIVGDPKQSIYRFRRADVRTYAAAHRALLAQGALATTITTNFRSRPGLVRFFNEQFGPLFDAGLPPTGDRFDPTTGRVRYDAIAADPALAPARPPVHILPYAGDGGAAPKATADGREIEAQALAHYLRWLVDRSGLLVRDDETSGERPVRYGDVAILAPATPSLGPLLAALDRHGIQYTAHGGTLFLSNPLVRRYLLALRAIADRDDGVAEAALLRPPFFALDLLDLVSPRLVDPPTADIVAARARLEAARALVRDLRRERGRRPAIDTAVDVIERTLLGRSVAVGPNGPQTLWMLYEVAFHAGRLALERGLDYDGVTRALRAWVEDPVLLDPPDASGPATVRVMTIHQAKGLEFPVVAVWDGFAAIHPRADATWLVARDGDGLALTLDHVRADFSGDRHLLAFDKELAAAERQRLFFVAMTRARDLLVLPEPSGGASGGRMLRAITKDAAAELIETCALFRRDAPPAWAAAGPAAADTLEADPTLGARIDAARQAFAEAAAAAATPRAVPTAATDEARRSEPVAVTAGGRDGTDVPGERAHGAAADGARFGRAFGSTVHRAVALALERSAWSLPGLVALAAREYGLVEHLEDARADAERAIERVTTLAGVTRPARRTATTIQVEYPLCAPLTGGRIMLGTVDVLIVHPDEVFLLDLKTDQPPAGKITLDAYPVYRRQLALYADALRASDLLGDRKLRAGVLFTATGEVAWS
jgi:ATP-dependent helicase/nuclease subunit A